MHYSITVRPDEGQYRAVCPQFPGIGGRGMTPGEALDAAIAALSERLEQQGDAPPEVAVVRAEVHGQSVRGVA